MCKKRYKQAVIYKSERTPRPMVSKKGGMVTVTPSFMYYIHIIPFIYKLNILHAYTHTRLQVFELNEFLERAIRSAQLLKIIKFQLLKLLKKSMVNL